MGYSFFSTSPYLFPGDLLFLSWLICKFTRVISFFAHFMSLKKLAWNCANSNNILDTAFFFAIVVCGLWHPSTKMNYKWLYLDDTFDTWYNRRGTYLQCLTYFFGSDVPIWRLMKQTHVYEHLFFYSHLFDLDIFQ